MALRALCAAEWAIARADLSRARHHIERALSVAQRTQSRHYIIRATRLRAACHTEAGNLADAELLLSSTVTQARSLGNPTQLWQALLAHGRVLHSLGRRDEAGGAWKEAAAFAGNVTAALRADLQAAFRISPVGVALEEVI